MTEFTFGKEVLPRRNTIGVEVVSVKGRLRP